MKQLIIKSLITAPVIGGVVWLMSYFFSFSYTEWSFVIGLGLTIVLFYFNSSGGFLARAADYQASQAMWKVQREDSRVKVYVGSTFYGSLLYTVVSLVVMMVTYS